MSLSFIASKQNHRPYERLSKYSILTKSSDRFELHRDTQRRSRETETEIRISSNELVNKEAAEDSHFKPKRLMETVNINTLYTMDTSYQNNILYKAFKSMQYKEKHKKYFGILKYSHIFAAN